jgi:hypothetical protein
VAGRELLRYARAHFALDALDSYAVIPDDGQRLVPNPAKKTASAQVKTARTALAGAEAARQRKLDQLRSPALGTTAIITNQDLTLWGSRTRPLVLTWASTPLARTR